jgi:hypothetical protein
MALGSACAREPLVAPWSGPSAAGAAAPVGVDTALLPARIRRLSNAEYNGSVAALLGTQLTPSTSFAPDARQAGFSVNEAQRVDAVLAKQLYAAAEQLAAEARERLPELAPCDTPDAPQACASAFIVRAGERAYRRPLSAEETAGLLEVYRAGALDADYGAGIELVIRALLQSAGFLYLSELGGPVAADGSVTLTSYEQASSLAYLMMGAPPDQPLLEAAASGELESPVARRSQLLRLRAEHPESRAQLVRTLREWLELDRIELTAKDTAFYPTYEQLAEHFSAESYAFVGAVLDAGALGQVSDLSALLGADWTVGDKVLGDFYQAQELGDGRLQLPTRRGILNQGAFLSVHAHAYESAPVLRGVTLARRLACIAVPAPAALGLSPVPPVADAALTTRQRFAAHASDATCAQCHKMIDGFGNAFEQYDGMGALRQTENSLPVDSATVVSVGADFDGAYADSDALAVALAGSATVQECFARYVFRAAAARSFEGSGTPDAAASEDAFIATWRTLPAGARGNLIDTLSAFVESRVFSQRRASL